MWQGNRLLAGAVALVLAAGPLAAQERGVVVSVLGGGYSQLVPLDGTHFNRGFTIGACGGVELSKIVALHADFTWARAIAHGPVPFSGAEVNNYFYGAHLELRAPFERGLVPFGFFGAGALTVDPGRVAVTGGVPLSGISASSMPSYPGTGEHAWNSAFTRPALTFGAGVFYLRVPGAPLELFFETKALLFHWDRAGYDQAQVDVTYALGMSYRFTW